jgi:hypothetical protein
VSGGWGHPSNLDELPETELLSGEGGKEVLAATFV